jgi:[ribosomal protein S18]-alanine N-acetyltransferase
MSANTSSPREGIEIRSMEEEDLDQILSIEQKSFVEPWSRKLFLETLAFSLSRNYVLETASKKILGYANFYVVQHEAHMLNIAVHPEWRKQGLAATLLGHTIRDLSDRGVREFFLEVREGNGDAISLYRKFGFDFIGRRKKYYVETNEDALVMRLQFDEN